MISIAVCKDALKRFDRHVCRTRQDKQPLVSCLDATAQIVFACYFEKVTLFDEEPDGTDDPEYQPCDAQFAIMANNHTMMAICYAQEPAEHLEREISKIAPSIHIAKIIKVEEN